MNNRSKKEDIVKGLIGYVQYINVFSLKCIIILQKLLERKSILEKASMSMKDKEKWTKVMKINMMSSEESDSNPNNDNIIVKPLEWRSTDSYRNLMTNCDCPCKNQPSSH